MSIPKETVIVEEEVTTKKPVFLYILLVICLLFLGGIIYLHYNPDILEVKLKKLDCTISMVKDFKLPIENSTRTIIKIKKHVITNKKYPRKYSIIKQRPL